MKTKNGFFPRCRLSCEVLEHEVGRSLAHCVVTGAILKHDDMLVGLRPDEEPPQEELSADDDPLALLLPAAGHPCHNAGGSRRPGAPRAGGERVPPEAPAEGDIMDMLGTGGPGEPGQDDQDAQARGKTKHEASMTTVKDSSLFSTLLIRSLDRGKPSTSKI